MLGRRLFLASHRQLQVLILGHRALKCHYGLFGLTSIFGGNWTSLALYFPFFWSVFIRLSTLNLQLEEYYKSKDTLVRKKTRFIIWCVYWYTLSIYNSIHYNNYLWCLLFNLINYVLNILLHFFRTSYFLYSHILELGKISSL